MWPDQQKQPEEKALDDEKDKKKGVAKFDLVGSAEEEAKYLDYVPMRPDMLNWEDLKLETNFAVKCYSTSVYRGQLDEGNKRSGLGVITYNSGRLYEGSWLLDKRQGLGYERF